MSRSSSDSWLALLDEKTQRLHQRASRTVSAVKDEKDFRNAFEVIAKSHHEKHTTRLLVRLSPSFENIIIFAETVAGPVPDLSSNALTSFVWGISLALIKVNSKPFPRASFRAWSLIVSRKVRGQEQSSNTS